MKQLMETWLKVFLEAGSNNDKAKYAKPSFEGKLVYHGLEKLETRS